MVVWYSHLFKNFPQLVVMHAVKGFCVVNEAVDVFVRLPCFLHDPTNVGNLISGSSASLKLSLYIGKFLIHILLKPILMDFENNFATMWNECNRMVVCTFFGACPSLGLEWELTFVLWPLLSFPNLLTYWVQHFNSRIISSSKPAFWLL